MQTQRSLIESGIGLLDPDKLTDAELLDIGYDWSLWARPAQLLPPGDWLTWLILAGRGYGKSRTGAETVREWVTSGERFPIALLGRTPADVRDVMIEGESGLLNVFPPNQKPLYEPSKRRVTFHTGIHATVFSSENPEQLRGPQHAKSWTDELGSFKTREAWDNLQLGLPARNSKANCHYHTPSNQYNPRIGQGC